MCTLITWKKFGKPGKKFEKIIATLTLCNLERLHLALADKRKILSKRKELITQFPHYLISIYRL